MSAFGRDLVGNANCGTANPLMQMAGQMQGMGAQVRNESAHNRPLRFDGNGRSWIGGGECSASDAWH